MAFYSNLHISLKNIIQMYTWDDRYVNIWDRHTKVTIKRGGVQRGVSCPQVPMAWAGFELTPLVVISTDCIGIFKSNSNKITTTAVPWRFKQTYTLPQLGRFLPTFTAVLQRHLESESTTKNKSPEAQNDI